MKIIKLSNSEKECFVDDEDYERIIAICDNWSLSNSGAKGVDSRSVASYRKNIMMHRLIMNLEYGDETIVDHIDFNQLNNQKQNLRLCSKQENAFHSRKSEGTTSKYKWVNWDKRRGLWRARLIVDGVQYWGGRYKTEEEAARKADELMKQHHGEFAVLNFPV